MFHKVPADGIALKLSFDDACLLLKQPSAARMIAIDGLPCSGKSTLASKLAMLLEAECLPVDDFFLPQSDWPTDIRPGFPFPFYRYEEFVVAIGNLTGTGRCRYFPFDWDEMRVSTTPRIVTLERPVIVEGASSLHREIARHYDIRFFVESDGSTMLEAILKRDGNFFEKEWRGLWLPSVASYMLTSPQERADFLVTGRGAAV